MRGKILLGLLTLILIAVPIEGKQPTVTRDNRVMCEEVTRELNIQVDAGMISRTKADKVITRCFELFVNAK